MAVSARMLAQLAVADGYEVTALDRFGDVDLRALAPGATAPTNDGLAALAADIEADAVVYGAGLENRPDLVRELADGRELLGTPPELLEAVRDPWEVGAAARAAGARAPETRAPGEPPQAAGRGGRARGHARRGCASHDMVAAGTACADGEAACCGRRRCCSDASAGCPARRSRSGMAGAPSYSGSPSSSISHPASGGQAT